MLARVGDKCGLDSDFGLASTWGSEDTRKEFFKSVKDFQAAVDAWRTADADARAAADSLASWAQVGAQALAIVKPIIDAELAKPAATTQDQPDDLSARVNKLTGILKDIQPLLGVLRAAADG